MQRSEFARRQTEPSAFRLQALARRERGQRLWASGVGPGEGAGGLITQALNIQCAPRADVGDPLGQLGGAGTGVGTAQIDIALLGRC